MSVGQNLNQLNQTTVKGGLSVIPNAQTVSCQILTSSTNAFVAASPVKLISGTAQQILVDLASPTDPMFGFIIYSVQKNKYVGGDRIEVALSESVMDMESGVAFNRGQTLEFQASGTQVVPWGGVNSHVGKALDTATASGQLVRVLITTTLEEGSSSSSSCSSSSSSISSSSSSCRSSSSSSSSRSSSSSSSSCRSSSSSSCSSSSSSRSSSSSCSSSSSNSSSSSSSSRSSSSSSSSSSFLLALP